MHSIFESAIVIQKHQRQGARDAEIFHRGVAVTGYHREEIEG